MELYKINGVHTPEQTLVLYQPIARSMSSCHSKVAPMINYAQLRSLPDAHRSDLVLWGLDVNQLSVANESVITHRFEVDLGL
jgi:hypothetical protein